MKKNLKKKKLNNQRKNPKVSQPLMEEISDFIPHSQDFMSSEDEVDIPTNLFYESEDSVEYESEEEVIFTSTLIGIDCWNT